MFDLVNAERNFTSEGWENYRKMLLSTYPVRDVGDGRLSLQGTCVEKHGQVAEITAQGTYAPTAFHLTARLRTKIAGVPLSGVGTTDARRLSETCPLPEPKPGRSNGR